MYQTLLEAPLIFSLQYGRNSEKSEQAGSILLAYILMPVLYLKQKWPGNRVHKTVTAKTLLKRK